MSGSLGPWDGRVGPPRRRRPRSAFTLVEMLVVTGVIVLLLAALTPSLYRAREAGYDSKCKSQLYRLGQILHTGGGYGVPGPGGWSGFVLNAGGGELLRCPKDFREHTRSERERLTTGGNVQQMSPPPCVVFNTIESNTLIRIFPEREDFALPKDVQVNIVAPGSYASSGAMGGGMVAAGTSVNCYFLFFDPVGKERAESSGSVTFTGEIIGLIVLDAHLDASDAVLGLSDTAYPTGQKNRGFESGAESIVLEPGSRTLRISRFSSTFPGENVRILTVSGPGTSSYGMNNLIDPISPRINQLMLVEYGKSLVDVDERDGRVDDFDEWLAPRHFDQANAVMVNGSVRAFAKGELRPTPNAEPWKR